MSKETVRIKKTEKKVKIKKNVRKAVKHEIIIRNISGVEKNGVLNLKKLIEKS